MGKGLCFIKKIYLGQLWFFRKIKINLHVHCISIKQECVFGINGKWTYTAVILVSIQIR